MKKYLGGYMLGYIAFVFPIIILIMLVMVIVPIASKICLPTILLSLSGILGAIITIVCLRQIALDVYSWGIFSEKGVVVKSLFVTHEIEYEKCESCGIGYYSHGVYNSKLGSKVRYIYLSYDGFEEKYRTRMNLFKNSHRQIKIAYNKKVYEYLINTLPKNHAKTLKEDYKKYI